MKVQGSYLWSLTLSLAASFSCSNDQQTNDSSAKAIEEYPRAEEYFEKVGVKQDGKRLKYTPEAYTRLQNWLKQSAMPWAKTNKRADSLDIYQHVSDMLDDALLDGRQIEMEKAFTYAIRAAYSTLADEMNDHREKNTALLAPGDLQQILTGAGNFINKEWATTFPYLTPAEAQKPVRKPSKEATNLVAQDGLRYMTEQRLALHSSGEIAKMDVPVDHPAIRRKADMALHKAPWRAMERWAEDLIKADLESEAKGKSAGYNLEGARKVLFLTKVENSGTSPKAAMKDRYGIKWKLKMGDESAVEAVYNRLMVRFGARYADLLYNDVGGKSHLVVLPTAEEAKKTKEKAVKDGESEPCVPTNDLEFMTCFAEARYRFNAGPYIMDGRVAETDQEAQALVTKYLPEQKGGKLAEKIKGHYYVVLRQSSAELAVKQIQARSGAVAQFKMQTQGDRAHREWFVFHLWSQSKDAREDNFKTVVLRKFLGGGDQLAEFFHDTGSMGGGTLSSGQINDLAVGDRFLTVDTAQRIVRSPQFLPYQPGVWSEATYADMLSGAMRLVTITDAQIREDALSTGWPDFMVEVFVSRMAHRRDRLAEVFGLGKSGPTYVYSSHAVDLTTTKQRDLQAAKYGLTAKEIEEAMANAELLDKDYVDVVVANGSMARCNRSIIISLLQQKYHPMGISDRRSRFHDHQLEERCEVAAPWRGPRADGTETRVPNEGGNN